MLVIKFGPSGNIDPNKYYANTCTDYKVVG